MKIVLASHNAHKAEEFREMLGPLGHEVVVATNWEAPEETGHDFVANARIKARSLKVGKEEAVLADDSGICIDALDGGPGIYSARFMGDDYAKKNAYVIAQADRTNKRDAYYVCALVLIDPQGQEHVFEATCQGTIAKEPLGTHGFGYDPVFIPAGQTLTFGQMTPQKKHEISHRGKALRMLETWMRENA